MKKMTAFVSTLLLSISLLAGCGAQTPTALAQNETDSSATSEGIISKPIASVTALKEDTMFTDRDIAVSYDRSAAKKIVVMDGKSTSDAESVTISGDTITIHEEGTYVINGTLSNGQIIIDSEDSKIQIVLDQVDITNIHSAAIYIKNADKVFITTADHTDNTLSTTGEFIVIDENNIDAVVFSKDDVTLNGSGTLTINSTNGHGVVSKDDLLLSSGTYLITAASHSLSGKNSVRILAGTFTLHAGKDGIHSENEEDTSLGFIYIGGGTFHIKSDSDALDASSTLHIVDGSFEITAGDDGIHADTQLVIDDGTIDILKCYEGIESRTILINDGIISLLASDDGINAASGNDQNSGSSPAGGSDQDSDCAIQINSGTLTIDALGDGIDSNGSLVITGGITTVSGPTNRGNGTLDYNGQAQISGGTLLAAGSSGMAQGFHTNSAQASILYQFDSVQSSGTNVVLKNEDGDILCEYAPVKEFQTVNISLPDLEQGNTYTLTAGSAVNTIELSGNTFTNATGGFGGSRGGNPGSARPKGVRPPGTIPEGGIPDGEPPAGGIPDGRIPDGEPPTGGIPDGGIPDGEPPADDVSG